MQELDLLPLKRSKIDNPADVPLQMHAAGRTKEKLKTMMQQANCDLAAITEIWCDDTSGVLH